MQYVLLLIANVISLNISFIAFVFDAWFPISIGYLKATVEIGTITFGKLSLLEIIWIKFWNEFKKDSVKATDERFVVLSLNVVNFFFSAYIAIMAVYTSAGNQPTTFGIVSPFDRFIEMNKEHVIFPRSEYFLVHNEIELIHFF